jgi:KaiC/GvpD/RAD55 family RecA-like ATPase
MSIQQSHYGFSDLPLSEMPAGTNVLVTGPALGGVRDLVLRMLLRQHSREGVVFLAADTSGVETLRAYEALGGDLDRARVGVVDCTEEGIDDGDRNIHAVGSPSDLTGVGIEFSSLYEALHENGARRVRTGVYTLAPFAVYASPKPVYRFVHTLTGRIRSADGLGVCAIDPDVVEDRTLSSLAQAFDGRVDLRNAEGETALRVQGLSDQPDGWQPLDLDSA